jgi:hypothetical protein
MTVLQLVGCVALFFVCCFLVGSAVGILSNWTFVCEELRERIHRKSSDEWMRNWHYNQTNELFKLFLGKAHLNGREMGEEPPDWKHIDAREMIRQALREMTNEDCATCPHNKGKDD